MPKTASNFDTEFERLRLSRVAEQELEAKHKQQVIDAPSYGISDNELARLLNRAYQSLKTTPAKLKALRAKWSWSPTQPLLIWHRIPMPRPTAKQQGVGNERAGSRNQEHPL